MLHCQDHSDNPPKLVPFSRTARSQARWWIVSLTAFKDGIRIPDPRAMRPCTYLELFTDAAGISNSKKSLNGWGSYALVDGVTVVALAPWDKRMATPKETYHRKLTLLEALAVANGIFSVADRIAGRHTVVWTDNKGLYHAAQKVKSAPLWRQN